MRLRGSASRAAGVVAWGLWMTTGSVSTVIVQEPAAGVQVPERRDAFWCPMHPDIRSAAREKCPICSMELVPIPPPTLGHYRLAVTQVPRRSGRGTKALRIEALHPDTSKAETAFAEIHERVFHLFIVGRDLKYFAHEHPTRSGSAFEMEVNLDPGAYVLIADFAPASGTPQLVQHAIVTPGFRASPFAKAILTPDAGDKIVDGVRISLTATAQAGRESVLRFTVTDAANGALLTDLEPYLGAAGHLLVVNADVTEAIHAHPEGTRAPAAGSGEVVFGPVLPAPGAYKLWVQFQRKGKVITAPFVIVAAG